MVNMEEISQQVLGYDEKPKSNMEKYGVEFLRRYIDKISEEDIDVIASSIIKTAEIIKANNFDYVIFTGSSRLLLKSLFMDLDIGSSKLLDFNVDENRQVYGRHIFEPTVDEVQDKHFYLKRAECMTKILQQKGVEINNAKIAVIDDHVSGGYKAREYLTIMRELGGLSDYKYIVPLANDSENLRKTIGDNLNHFLISQETDKIFSLLSLLSDALHATDGNRHKVTAELYSRSGEVLFRNTVRDSIKAIRDRIHKDVTKTT